MGVESGHYVDELARTPEQLYAYIILEYLDIRRAIDKDLEEFAGSVGIKGLQRFFQAYWGVPEDRTGLEGLEEYDGRWPLRSILNENRPLALYNGSFPVNNFGGLAWWNNACSCEISEDILGNWPTEVPIPKWLQTGAKRELFEEYYTAGRLREAWLTLNSNGWMIPDARVAITKLAEIADDKGFSLLTDAWLAVSMGDATEY